MFFVDSGPVPASLKAKLKSVSSFFLLGLVALGGGCASGGGASTTAAESTEPTSTATRGEAFRDAEAVANREPGRMTAKGNGASMEPVYGDNTLLVINPIRYEDLKPGMTVAYVSSKGIRVVHKLVSKTNGGWYVIGINNARVDEDLVTPQNLIGVIYASFHYTDEEP